MRVLIIAGRDCRHRIEIANEDDYPLYKRAVSVDVEAHNSINPVEDWWVWGEEGTDSDPALAPKTE